MKPTAKTPSTTATKNTTPNKWKSPNPDIKFRSPRKFVTPQKTPISAAKTNAKSAPPFPSNFCPYPNVSSVPATTPKRRLPDFENDDPPARSDNRKGASKRLAFEGSEKLELDLDKKKHVEDMKKLLQKEFKAKQMKEKLKQKNESSSSDDDDGIAKVEVFQSKLEDEKEEEEEEISLWSDDDDDVSVPSTPLGPLEMSKCVQKPTSENNCSK